MDEDQKAGTTPQNGGDDAAQAALAGTTEQADRDAGAEGDEKRTDWKALYLSSKDKIERANQLEREKAELEERLRATETSPTDAPQSPDEAVAREMQEEYIELLQRAQAGDVLAKRELRRWEAEAVRQRELADELYLARMRDAEQEAELRKFYKANRSHFNSIAAAHDALAGRTARAAQAELSRKQKAAEEIIERKDADVVKTHQRDVGAGEVKVRKMTEAQFTERIRELESAGKMDEAMALARQARRGSIVVT